MDVKLRMIYTVGLAAFAEDLGRGRVSGAFRIVRISIIRVMPSCVTTMNG